MAERDLAAGSGGTDAAALRLRMVNGQLRTSDVSDALVLSAFLAVPRENFTTADARGLAYLDRDVAAAGAAQRKLLAPRTLGRLIQAAAPKPGERALDVGGGSGYSAAVLAELGCEVVMLESDAGALAAAREALKATHGVTLTQGGLATGAPQGPFDIIVINGAFEVTPAALIAKLSEGGRLVGLDARGDSQCGALIEKLGESYSERLLFDARAEVLPGLERAAKFAF
jgi:protein-L-isoaspartate(D-aspartate) O-methyltransferase